VIVHEPVLLQEVLGFLVPPADGGLMVDATLGQAGHAEAFLLKYPRLVLVGLDADPAVLETARARLAPFGDRARFANEWFAAWLPAHAGKEQVNLLLMDLGISRFHYEASGRGFSFDRDEPLDMRLDPRLPVSAADIVNTWDPADITDVLFRFGEEQAARSITNRIVRERGNAPITSAARLAALVAAAVPAQRQHRRLHPATKTFQALRIAVNGELEQLERALAAIPRLLAPGGRVGIISFHSLEDRLVKHFFRQKSRECTCPPEWPICQCGGKAELRLVTTKSVTASEEEVARNPASRSARLRVAERPAKGAEGAA
jgi:16S rRNA (cytosine1402-N4)-methyltransferase